ncbi:MAG: prepilin-type N-terminal cleavage/methylation domain-containing protein [Fimbriimonadales bacterium]|nr:prepilin-type N-terminal cleavage/methylation domain-containing protein [Fimbriimonadales bacterium]
MRLIDRMQARQGFTLTEMLFALATLAVLVALLLPFLSTARRKAKEAQCAQQLAQIGSALNLYREDFDLQLPERLSHLVPAYVTTPSLLVCPLDPKGGQWEGTNRLEGNRFLRSGVSYTWVPNWEKAIGWGWWKPWPARGPGKWGEMTPVSECHWHWATTFNQFWEGDRNQLARGNALILTLGGKVISWPGKRSVEEFTPGG